MRIAARGEEDGESPGELGPDSHDGDGVGDGDDDGDRDGDYGGEEEEENDDKSHCHMAHQSQSLSRAHTQCRPQSWNGNVRSNVENITLKDILLK